MRTAHNFGPWTPDLPPSGHKGLVIARNCRPSPNGYRPLRGFSDVTTALTGWAGGGAFVGSDGTATLLSGTSTDLYTYSSGSWTSVLGELTATRWRFSQFGNVAICVNGAAPVAYDLTGGTAAELTGSPPDADLVATVRDFVVLAGNPQDILTVTWSAFNDETGWTASTDQSGFQPMLEGGEVMGLVGGEYGVILQRNRIVRMTYTADDFVFQFDAVETNIGCISKGSVAQAGRLVFFLSERGFMVFDGTATKPIGHERVDATFFASYARSDIESSLYAAIDPRNFNVIWSMPGVPGRLWIYNWVTDKWSDAEVSNIGLFSGFTANVALEALDALYPGGLDTIPYSLDASIFSGGEPLLFVASDTGVVGTLSGDILPAMFRTAFLEVQPGRQARFNGATPIGDATEGILTIDARVKLGDAQANVSSSSMMDNGDVPIRCQGRYAQATWQPSGTWTFAQGLLLDHGLGGRR